MILSNSTFATLRKIAGYKNRGFLAGEHELEFDLNHLEKLFNTSHHLPSMMFDNYSMSQ